MAILNQPCKGGLVRFDEIAPEDIPADVVSAIGHADTAAVLCNMLGFEVPMNRMNISLDEDTEIYVAQLIGGRLPEGSTTLPEGFSFKFYRVTMLQQGQGVPGETPGGEIFSPSAQPAGKYANQGKNILGGICMKMKVFTIENGKVTGGLEKVNRKNKNEKGGI